VPAASGGGEEGWLFLEARVGGAEDTRSLVGRGALVLVGEGYMSLKSNRD
jgi:hypothetical protein